MPPVKPKKRRIWPWLLLGIPLLFAILIGGCSLLLFGAVRGPVDATNGYIANLDNGDYGAAYDSLCAKTRSAIDRDEWISGIGFEIGGEITDYNFSQVDISGSNASVTGTIDVDGASRSRIFDLVDEGGEWRVCFD